MTVNQHHLRTFGSRHGPGKVHLRYGINRPECNPSREVYGEPVGGDVPLTCAKCIRLVKPDTDHPKGTPA